MRRAPRLAACASAAPTKIAQATARTRILLADLTLIFIKTFRAEAIRRAGFSARSLNISTPFAFRYDADRTIVLKQRGAHLFNAGASGFAQSGHYLMASELGMLQSLLEKLAGEELVGSVGVRAHTARHVDVFGSFSYDNNDAKLFRTGVTVKY